MADTTLQVVVEPESPLRVTRRRNSRATGGRTPRGENAAPKSATKQSAAKRPANRFGFKKRSPKEAAAEEVVGFALRAEFEAGVAPGGGSLAPARFDADAVAALLAGRLQTPKPKVHTEFKARCQELTDVNKQLRDALREHHERERSLDGVLGGLEDSVNAKLNVLASDAKAQRAGGLHSLTDAQGSPARHHRPEGRLLGLDPISVKVDHREVAAKDSSRENMDDVMPPFASAGGEIMRNFHTLEGCGNAWEEIWKIGKDDRDRIAIPGLENRYRARGRSGTRRVIRAGKESLSGGQVGNFNIPGRRKTERGCDCRITS